MRCGRGIAVFRLCTFMPMIIGEIRRYLRDNSALRVSRSLRDTAYKAMQAKEAFIREHQREPDIMELAKAMDVPKEEVVFALDAILDPVSLFEPVFHDGTDTVCVMDQVGDNKNTDEQWLASIALREAIDSLNDREKKIIRLRFFEGRTQMEVADEIHISRNEKKQFPQPKSSLEELHFSRPLSAYRGEYEVVYYINWRFLI